MQRRRHKWRNALQSLLLLGGMIGLLGLCLALIAGPQAVIWGIMGAALGLMLTPRISPRMILRMYGAQLMDPFRFPALYRLVDVLCRRAELEHPPRLYYVPSTILNAFAVGHRDDSAVAVTDGLLRNLSRRELAGVLAHEISHIRNGDLWVMSLADLITRLTSVLAYLGILLLTISLPWALAGEIRFPWLLGMLLVFAPTIGSLLQLALSRAREYDADLDAAGITGDPIGLAMALDRLERYQGRFWEEILMPGRRMPDPSLLRTHPPTEERIRRLRSLYAPDDGEPLEPPRGLSLPQDFPRVRVRPHWRRFGAWY